MGDDHNDHHPSYERISNMFLKRKDGNEITLSEEKIVLELFKGRTYPTPYTHTKS